MCMVIAWNTSFTFRNYILCMLCKIICARKKKCIQSARKMSESSLKKAKKKRNIHNENCKQQPSPSRLLSFLFLNVSQMGRWEASNSKVSELVHICYDLVSAIANDVHNCCLAFILFGCRLCFYILYKCVFDKLLNNQTHISIPSMFCEFILALNVSAHNLTYLSTTKYRINLYIVLTDFLSYSKNHAHIFDLLSI